MNIDDIIAIIFILIFFIGPLFKKIFDAVSSDSKPKKMDSNQVQEYLKKMREYSDPNRPKGYQAPSSHSYKKSNTWSQDRYVANTPKKEKMEKIYEKAYKKLTPNIETTLKADVNEAYKRNKDEQEVYKSSFKPYQENQADAVNGISKIFKSTKYTDLQKAMILSEILKKPSC